MNKSSLLVIYIYIYSLRVLCKRCTLSVHFIIYHPTSLPSTSSYHCHSHFVFSLWFTRHLDNCCCLYTCGCRVIHWNIVSPPGSTPLKRTDALSPGSHQVPQPGVGLVSLFPIRATMWTLMNLMQGLVEATIAT